MLLKAETLREVVVEASVIEVLVAEIEVAVEATEEATEVAEVAAVAETAVLPEVAETTIRIGFP